MARSRDRGGVGGGQGQPGFFRRLINLFRRRSQSGERRRTCCRTEYRCELIDRDSGEVIASSYSVVDGPCGQHQLTTANAARRLALNTNHFSNRRGSGYTTFEEARRRHPSLYMRCTRSAGPYEIPGPC